MKRRYLSSLLGVGVACLLGAGAVLPETALSAGLNKSFSYFANGHELRTVLTGFAKAQGLSAAFDGDAVKGRVSGRFQKVAPKDFLLAMSEAYEVGYYVLGDTIHFYPASAVKKEFLTVPAGSAKSLVDSLKRSGFIASELPVSVNAEGNMLTMNGPEAYLTSIRAAADAYLAVQSEKIEMRVFPIRHAWADDIELTNMDRTVTVPGIASILRGMVLGQSVGGTTVTGGANGPARAESVPSLGAEGLSRQKKRDTQSGPVNATPVAQGAVSIIADPRVNAVLVSDFAYRMPYYEEVIKSLDKPVELVEIHAAIVDIDTNASRELGVNFRGKGGGNWQGGGSLGSENTPVGSGTPGISTDLSSGGALLSTIYTHGSDYFMASINALESENAARMLGRPSVLTVDNVEAVLENTTTYYIPLRGQEAVDLYRVEAGTVLRVTPHIIHEGGKTSIKLAVSVQDDQNDASSGYQTVGETGDRGGTVASDRRLLLRTKVRGRQRRSDSEGHSDFGTSLQVELDERTPDGASHPNYAAHRDGRRPKRARPGESARLRAQRHERRLRDDRAAQAGRRRPQGGRGGLRCARPYSNSSRDCTPGPGSNSPKATG